MTLNDGTRARLWVSLGAGGAAFFVAALYWGVLWMVTK